MTYKQWLLAIVRHMDKHSGSMSTSIGFDEQEHMAYVQQLLSDINRLSWELPDMQAMVRDFMEACDQVIGDRPGLRDQLLRIRLVTEEPGETARAIYGGDLLEAIDGLSDSLYVILGTAVAFGVDIYPFFKEVHRSNMAKRHPETGKVEKDLYGKVIKPADWTPPDIEGVFRRLYGDPAEFKAEQQSHDDKWHEVFRMAEHNGWGPETLMEWMEERSSLGRDKSYG